MLETPTWMGNAEANTFGTTIALQRKLLSNDLIPNYAEYMESQSSQLGFARWTSVFSALPIKILRATARGRLKWRSANPTAVL